MLLKCLKDIVRKQKSRTRKSPGGPGSSRTRVTAILNDDLERVSTDLLIRILASLGYQVKVLVIRTDTAS